MLTAKDLNNLLTQFVDHLVSTGASKATVKNYLSDLSKVFAKLPSEGQITSIELYSTLEELKLSFSGATIRRFSFSLKSFVGWAKSQGYNLEVINQVISQVEPKASPVESYLTQLHNQGAPKTTVENYTKDLSRFLFWMRPNAKSLAEVDNKTVSRVSTLDIRRYINYLKSKSFSQASINRYLFSLKDFFKYNKKEVVFDNNPVKPNFLNQNLDKQPRWKRLIKYRPVWWHAYRGHPISDYINYAALAAITLFIGLGLYQQLFVPKPAAPINLSQLQKGLVLAATPPRILSFQGRLTSNTGTPIVAATSVVFNIYTVSTGGSTSWASKTWTVTPDQNGIFSVCLGGQDANDDCLSGGGGGSGPFALDTVIPASLFSDNAALYLGVTIGGDAEATPRQRIASSTYALNSDSLDGIDSTGFVQLQPAAAQANTGSTTLIHLDETGGSTPDLIDLKVASASQFKVTNGGNVTLTGTLNTNTFTGSALAFGTANSNISTTGTLGITGGTTLSLSSTTSSAITLDSGTTGTVNVGTNNNAKTINLGTGTAGNTVNIGTNNTTLDTINIGSALDDVAITGDQWSVTNAGVLTVVSCTGCGGGSQTPWTSDIDADGYDLTDLSNIDFRETTGAPAGSSVAVYRDNSGDLNLNSLTARTINLQVNGADEYSFSSSELTLNSNNITGVGTINYTAGTTDTGTVVCRNSSGILAGCSGTAGTLTLQGAYDGGNTITTTTARDIAFTLADVATPTKFSLTQQDPSGTSAFYLNNANASGTNTNGLLIEQTNAGTLTNGLNIKKTSGTVSFGITLDSADTGLRILTPSSTGISVSPGTSLTTGIDIGGAIAGASITTGYKYSMSNVASGNVSGTDGFLSSISCVSCGVGTATLTNGIHVVSDQATSTVTNGINIEATNSGVITNDISLQKGGIIKNNFVGAINMSTTLGIGSSALNFTQAAVSFAGNVASFGGSGYGYYILANETTATTTFYNIYSANSTVSGAGAITNNYGLYIEPMAVGSTADYGAAIGAAGTQTLWLSNNANSTTAAGGIAFGSSLDTKLYRSAANTLSLLSGGTLTSAGAITISTSSNGALNLSPNGSGDVVLSQGAGSQLSLSASAGTTVDQLAITNASGATSTTAINGESINFNTTGTTNSADNSALRIDVTSNNNGTTTTLQGIKIGDLNSAEANATETGLYIGTSWDTGISIGTNSNATAIGMSIGALTGATADTGLDIGNISTGTTQKGINIGTLTAINGGTARGIQIGASSSAGATATSITGVDIGGITTTNVTTSRGILIGALSGSGTTGYGIEIAAGTKTGTTAAGILVGALSGAATDNMGIHIQPATGGTRNAGICFDCDSSYSSSTVGSGISFGGGGETTTQVLRLYRSNGAAAAQVTIDDGAGTVLIQSNTTTTSINLSAQVGGTAQRLCHNGADAATGVQQVGDCGGTQADLAEYYDVTDNAQAGEIVALDGNASQGTYYGGETTIAQVKKSSKTYQRNLIGIVSTNPNGEILGEASLSLMANPKAIALAGRVPVKVSSENGAIAAGDPLTSSSIPGVAMKATANGFVIAKALEDFDSPEVGTIVAFIHNSYYPGSLEYQNAHQPAPQLLTLDSNNNMSATISASAKFVWKNTAGQVVAYVTDAGEALFAKVTALVGNFGKLVFGEAVVKKDAKTAGQASFAANDTEVVIPSDKVKDDSIINLTPISKTGGVHLYIKEIKAGESFTVGLERAAGDQPTDATASASEAIKFSWFILNQE